MRLTSDSVLDGLPAGTSGVMNDYRRIVRRRLLLILLLALLIVASLLLDFMLGPSGLPLQSLWQTLTDPASADPGTRAIVWDIRLPYAVMAIIVGLALGLAGAEMQTILNNPLASPFTLGVSSAAAFGAALAIVLGIGLPGIPGQWFISANAFIFALLAALLLDGIVKPRHIDRVCRFLVANMAFFFVAPCAGIIEHVESLLACLLPFLCAAILTTPLVYAATAWSIQLMLRARRRKESHHA